MGGGALYRALAPSGPNQSSGPQSPETDDGTYWINESDVVHKSGIETIAGNKIFLNNPYLNNTTLDFTQPITGRDNEYLVFSDGNGLAYAALMSQVASNYQALKLLVRPMDDFTSELKAVDGVGVSIHTDGTKFLYPIKAGFSLGSSGNNRWSEIWGVTTTISTSDERIKTKLESVPDSVLDAWEDIHWGQFKFLDSIEKKGETARLHNGLVAQEIQRLFNSHDLDITKYGLFCHDSWEAVPEEKDEQGNIIEEAKPAGDEYSLRYEEALCMEAAYQRRENRRLKDRVSELENKVLQLEEKLNQLLNN